MSGYTPMMQQYLHIKEQHPDSILFFRLGDFYEMFFQDAKTAAEELDLTLTAREAGKGNRVPMAGVPHHAAENYIARLIEKGFTVAICDQVEDPREAKGVVKRAVTRIITPGTILDPGLLAERKNNYLCAVILDAGSIGIAAVDISTGLFICTQFGNPEAEDALINELARLNPAEVLIPVEQKDTFTDFVRDKDFSFRITQWHDSFFSYAHASQVLAEALGEYLFDELGQKNRALACQAAGAVFAYILDTQKNTISHIQELTYYEVSSYMVLDAATRRNLELTQTIRDHKAKGSLLWVIDRTRTAMGSRFLRQWLEQPLKHRIRIDQRLDAVEEFCNNSLLRSDLRESLGEIQDLERLMSRSSCGQANARDIQALASSLSYIPVIRSLLADAETELLMEYKGGLNDLQELVAKIQAAIVDDPPMALKDGGLIQNGYHPQIDQYREAARDGKKWLNEYEALERDRTGIKNLRIGYNRVFGYYFTVTKSYSHLVPDDYQRKQTLANAERYTTEQLLEYEALILGAEEKLVSLEYEVFCALREDVNSSAVQVLKNAHILAALDAVASLAEVAVRNDYVRPEINNSQNVRIHDGRHPVVEQMLPAGEFVPNDTHIGPDNKPILLITGPNMAGKSTYMRQTALIVLLAQIGSFVPASAASIGVVDRIFTRVGAQDDLASGHSTFMVEMTEMAHILHHATPQSLLLLDEVGRGTSTFDGLSIAWAVTEYIHNHPQLGCKTLFATHYHELTDLEDLLPDVKNYSIAVREKGEQVIFLRKIVEGGADRSYGIQVARLAGLPAPVLKRAKDILYMLEERDEMTIRKSGKSKAEQAADGSQLAFFSEPPHPLFDEIRKVSIDDTTPIEALRLIQAWQEHLKNEGESR
jgi:DNA mismatch repair protein MutS